MTGMESILKQLFDYYVKRRTVANVNWECFFKNWSKNMIIELESALYVTYLKGYEFSERKLGAWQTILKAAGATNITPWSYEELQVNVKFIAILLFSIITLK